MTNKVLFPIWLGVLLIVGLAGAYALRSGLRINQDFLSVFPTYEERGDFYKANALYEQRFADDVLVMLVADNKDRAVEVAGQLVTKVTGDTLFSKTTQSLAEGNQSEFGQFLFAHRQALLNEKQISTIEQKKTDVLVSEALGKLYSPMGTTAFLKTDPLGLFQDYMMDVSKQFPLRPYQGFLLSEKDGRAGVLVRLKVDRSASGLNERLVEFYSQTKTFAKSENVNAALFGATLFSAFGSEKSMNEVSIYGTLSLIAVLLLLIGSFSSIIPVVASFATVLLSVTAGLVAVLLIHSSIHILSVLLGISVLGVVTDYCTHFFAKSFDASVNSSEEVVKKIKGALGLGFLTNVLTYICFYLTELVVLQQLAIFTIAGVFITYLTVIAVFPKLKFKNIEPKRLQKSVALTSIWSRFEPRKVLFAATAVVALGVVVVRGFEFNDDVRLLQAADQDLKTDEAIVFDYLGISRAPSYFVVKGENEEQLLLAEEDLRSKLTEMNLQARAISQFVPSQKRQQESIGVYGQLEPAIKNFYQQLKMKDSGTATKQVLQNQAKPFAAEEALRFLGDSPLATSWLGDLGEGFYSVVGVIGETSLKDLKTLENSSRHFVNKSGEITEFLKVLRETISEKFVIVFAVLVIVLFAIYRSKKAIYILLPPVLSAIATLVIASAIWDTLNLFHLLAVLLIFCLGMDYSVFFAESKGSALATHIGIFISFLSTVGSFGVLALSSTHAVSSFGFSVFFGITICYLLSPLAAGASHE